MSILYLGIYYLKHFQLPQTLPSPSPFNSIILRIEPFLFRPTFLSISHLVSNLVFPPTRLSLINSHHIIMIPIPNIQTDRRLHTHVHGDTDTIVPIGGPSPHPPRLATLEIPKGREGFEDSSL